MKKLALTTALVGLSFAAFPALSAPQYFDTPDAAAEAVATAITANDKDALVKVFGTEYEDVALTGDDAADRAVWGNFIDAYRLGHRIDRTDDTTAILHIGMADWAFPAPIVKSAEGWSFDGAAGRDEVFMRRIGLNELDVIELLQAGVDMQAVYRQTDHDGDGVLEFAASILSTPGQRDGLYWPDEPGTEPSPIGAFMASAAADGISIDGTDEEPDPYLGYYFRILQKQGPAAPGGAHSYMVGGNMVAGHAILAYPADYGETGIMTFIVGENGVVYQSDLGRDTLNIASGIETFNPGEGWSPTGD